MHKSITTSGSQKYYARNQDKLVGYFSEKQ